MRKFLIGAGALLGLAAVNVDKVHACSDGVCVAELGTGKSVIDAAVVGAVMGTITYFWGDFIIGSVYRDIKAGGLNRKFAEVVPGSGYSVQSADVSLITPSPEYTAAATNLGNEQRAQLVASFNAAMAEEAQYASASQ